MPIPSSANAYINDLVERSWHGTYNQVYNVNYSYSLLDWELDSTELPGNSADNIDVLSQSNPDERSALNGIVQKWMQVANIGFINVGLTEELARKRSQGVKFTTH